MEFILSTTGHPLSRKLISDILHIAAPRVATNVDGTRRDFDPGRLAVGVAHGASQLTNALVSIWCEGNPSLLKELESHSQLLPLVKSLSRELERARDLKSDRDNSHLASFSAAKHKDQRRKGAEKTPYINHPIDVAAKLRTVGRVRDIAVIVAAILHDTVEDTETTFAEIEENFGVEVRSLVQEVIAQ